MSRRPTVVRRMAAAILAALAVGAAAHGAWIPVKAAVAQRLLDRSFAVLQAGHAPVPPWPWADIAPVARLTVERLSIERLVLDSATGAALAFGPGHIVGTPRPGDEGNVAIAGHRDTHFAFLADLRIGDRIALESAYGEQQIYEIEWTQVVESTATWVTRTTFESNLTLVTCYPFGGIAGEATERFVVRARAVS